jgi:hypothetical protein
MLQRTPAAIIHGEAQRHRSNKSLPELARMYNP